MVAISFPHGVGRNAPEIRQFVDLLAASQSVLRMGSAALNLAYVAAGRFDGYWAPGVKSWDVAAGMLLVSEAGGMVSDLAGGRVDLDVPVLVAASMEQLNREIRSLITASQPA